MLHFCLFSHNIFLLNFFPFVFINSEYEKETAKKRKWSSSELLSPFNIPFLNTNTNTKPSNSNDSNINNSKPFIKGTNHPRKGSNTTDQLPSRTSSQQNHVPSPYIKKHRRTQSGVPQRQRYKHVDEIHNSIDWISRDKSSKQIHTPLLPNFSPASVDRVPSAKYGKTKAELRDDDDVKCSDDDNESSLSFFSNTTKNAVGGAAGIIAGFASSLWSSYGSKIASNTIDSTRNAEKKYSKTKQDVRKRISKLSSTVHPKLSNVPSTVSNVLKPLYHNNDNDEKSNLNDKPSDFHNYSPPRRLPFEKPIKSNPEQKKMKNLSPDNKVDDDSDNDQDLFDDDEVCILYYYYDYRL